MLERSGKLCIDEVISCLGSDDGLPLSSADLTLYQMTKFQACPKLKAFADNKSNVTQNVKLVFHRIENIVGKEEKCWLPAFFFFFCSVFKKAFSSSASKVVIAW